MKSNKKILLTVAGLSSVMLLSFTGNFNTSTDETTEGITESESVNAPEKFMLDPEKCKLEWTCKGVGKQHNGTITISTGSIVVDTKQITSIYTYIDMKTIKDQDIKDAGFNKQLTDHLKSADFFNISKFPSATFKMTKATRLDVPEGQVNYTIVGDLMIKGITKSVEFPATVIFGKKKINANATLSIDRTQWDIKYNSGNFFQDLGDKLIEDKIDIKIALEGVVK
jgi:polyisoprenoid-binding protein YceI